MALILSLLAAISLTHSFAFKSQMKFKGYSSVRIQSPNSALFVERSGKAIWGGEEGEVGTGAPYPIHPELLNKLDETLGMFATKAAIDTSSHYMLEFRNEIDQRWMTGFRNYSSEGFGDKGRWTDWIEDMINTETTVVQVLMNPPKALLRGRRAGSDNGVRLEYMHEVEPRKIAHQIITIRESLTTELIQDLNCIKSENIEAMRYAQSRLEMGEEEAERYRKMTRTDTSGGMSTPLRERNYLECGIIVTNYALEQLRIDLQKRRDSLGIKFLDDMLEKMSAKDDERSVLDRVLHEFYAPRELIEEIYLKGLEQGVEVSSGLNTLKIAESLLQARYAISLQVNRILLEQDRFSRNYLKMIRDKGGFQTWKSSTERAKVRIVDVSVDDALKAAEKEAARLKEEERVAAAAAEAALQAAKMEQEAAVELEKSKPAAPEFNDDEETLDLGSFGSMGPILM